MTPPVGPLPALSKGYVTFGVFNNRLKMNGNIFPLWHQILQQLPDARLVLKFPGGSDEALVEELMQEMAATGIDRHRVTVSPLISFADHMTLYAFQPTICAKCGDLVKLPPKGTPPGDDAWQTADVVGDRECIVFSCGCKVPGPTVHWYHGRCSSPATRSRSHILTVNSPCGRGGRAQCEVAED